MIGAKFLLALSALVLLATPVFAQVQTEVPAPVPGAKPVTVEHIKVHSAAIEGNLEGEPADRDVIVFLPPSYNVDKHRRYPVVYALHGYFISVLRMMDGSLPIGRPNSEHRRLMLGIPSANHRA